MNTMPTPAEKPSRTFRPRRCRALTVLLFVGAALSLPAAAQPRIGQGSLLVATDKIGDPSWSQTVVLVIHHDSNGAVGVAINRPTEVPLEELVPDLADVPNFEGRLFRGGPVRPTQLVFLVRDPPPDMLRNAPRILEGIYASGDLGVLPEVVGAGGEDSLRLYAGHIEWAPGQLDREIADERWTVTMGSRERVFSPNPSLLWQRLRNAGDELLVEGSVQEAAAPASLAAPAHSETEIRFSAHETPALVPRFALNPAQTRASGPAASTDPR